MEELIKCSSLGDAVKTIIVVRTRRVSGGEQKVPREGTGCPKTARPNEAASSAILGAQSSMSIFLPLLFSLLKID